MDEQNWFFREMEEGVIHFRDRLQFELKSEFFVPPNQKEVRYCQDFYFLVPESLKIQLPDYPKEQFYRDSTTIIRYKTPYIPLDKLADQENPLSPFFELVKVDAKTPLNRIEYLLQVISNIFRSQIRETVKELMEKDEDPEKMDLFIDQFVEFKNSFFKELSRLEKISAKVSKLCADTREFQMTVAENYLTYFLYALRHKNIVGLDLIDQKIAYVIQEIQPLPSSKKEEEVLLHFGQLNKWVYEALSLKVHRIEIEKKHHLVLGVVTATIATSIYFFLFNWNVSKIAINTFWFFFLGVFIYILRDAIKDGLRDLYKEKLSLYFPDYTTDIFSPDGEKIGQVRESVRYIPFGDLVEKGISPKQTAKSSEKVLSYRREILLKKQGFGLFESEIVTLFRFNIHRFLEKANDEVQMRLRLNKISSKIEEVRLPKIYPIEVVLKTHSGFGEETKEFVIVINKKGIERVRAISA